MWQLYFKYVFILNWQREEVTSYYFVKLFNIYIIVFYLILCFIITEIGLQFDVCYMLTRVVLLCLLRTFSSHAAVWCFVHVVILSLTHIMYGIIHRDKHL